MSTVVAVVGATGVVGREMLRCLEQRDFPAHRVLALASARSSGRELLFRGKTIPVQPAVPEAFEGVDIALFSAGGGPSRELAPEAAKRGATVIDNSSAWRMDPDVPLVVPEVNAPAATRRPKGIIANPNCSTIQMVVALGPLHEAAGLKHIVVSTYQAASGKGQAAVAELEAQIREIANGQVPAAHVFPAQLANNVVMDWKAGPDEYSEEELKMVNETKKIFADDSIGVSATTVRVPVVTGHSESVHVQFHRPMTAKRALELLRDARGVTVTGPPFTPGQHPQPVQCVGKDDVFVGRIRDDLAVQGAINMWIVSDNLRKGAALNAVQIAELISA